VFFYYKFIFIKEFIKHDEVNYQCCDARYFVFHFSLYMHNLVEETIWSMLAQESLKALDALRLLSLGGKICLIKRVFALCTIIILYIKSRPIDEYIMFLQTLN